MKTITFSSYQPWGSIAYCVECWYQGKLRTAFEGRDYDALLSMAKAWATTNGYTHYTMHRSVRSKL